MIIQWLAEMFYKIFTGLLSWINLPSLDPEIKSAVINYIDMIFGTGLVFFKFFIPDILVKVGLPVILIVSAFKYGYYFVMWIIKKIPMAGIS